MPDAKLSRVVEAIEAYFARHPDAADSAEGIASWWLAGAGIEARVDEVLGALAILAAYLLLAYVVLPQVVARRMPDGRLIYVRGPRRQDIH